MTQIKAVRIICDGLLKDTVLDRLLGLGASGYTWWPAHGKGRQETVPFPFEGLERIYIEVWCSEATAVSIVEYCEGKDFRHRGMSVGVETLEVKNTEASKYT